MIHVFIVNPIACDINYARELRKYLSTLSGIEYYVLTSKAPGDEGQIARLMCHFFDNDIVRIYCCGESGSFKHILNGVEDLSKVELALIPYGDCSFLYNFCEDDTPFRNIESMIHGNVVHVDYIETNMGRALNSVSCGMDATFIRSFWTFYGLSIFGSAAPRFFANLKTNVLGCRSNFEVLVDEEPIQGAFFSEVFFGNGAYIINKRILGIDKTVNDGVASYYIAPGGSIKARMSFYNSLTSKDLKKKFDIAQNGHCQSIKIRTSTGATFGASLDGDVLSCTELKASIVHQGLAFVIPKEVMTDGE